MDFGVDVIQCHNLRLLAGTEINSEATRKAFGFTTRIRLIHGDAGVYRAPERTVIRAFEYEESLRSTSTLREQDMFTLRKLHFLVDCAWNTEVWKPLLKVAQRRGLNPLDALLGVLKMAEGEEKDGPLGAFFARFDAASREEWFDDAAAVETISPTKPISPASSARNSTS